MTGRELIIYILENGLENEPIFKDGKFIGFMTPIEAAVKMNVTAATVVAWVKLGMLKSVMVGDTLFIPADAKSPLEGNNETKA